MPFTSHGHAFGVIDADAPRPPRARCGGTALCPQCKSEAIIAQAVVAIMTNDAPPPGAALVVRPGDVLVVLMPRNANPADVDPIARQWHESYPDTPVRFMIGPEQIAVMRKGVDWCIDCNRPAAECACPS